MQKRTFTHNIIAMVYDFDGTLSPQPMQEYSVLPEIDVEPKKFWNEVSKQTEQTKAEPMLVYMRHLIEEAFRKEVDIKRNDFKRLGKEVKYFKGVETWFDRINKFVKEHGNGKVKIRHYIISAGLKEILEGVSIKKHFHKVFASEYHFDHRGIATFPKVLITDTAKTQFLFRINKGKEDILESINDHMPEQLRPIPFTNIIYIGDGLTDVPSMTVTRVGGGNSIAVYKNSGKGEKTARSICRKLLMNKRANLIAPADYAKNGLLEKSVHLILKSVIANIDYERELFNCRRKYDI
jgi:phosphoserine phosphatase